MTEKANPSINRNIDAFKTAGAIAYGGHEEGFVIDGANPTQLAVQDTDITESNLNTFAETSSASSFDVTIDAGEAFVFGSWLAIDTGTTVTLASSTNNQTVYVGWNKDGSDDVIVGLNATFDNATGNTDQKIPLWTFDTDSSGVTSVTDERSIGYTQQATSFEGNINLANSDAIQDAGSDAITFDGSQNVTIPNGNLDPTTNAIESSDALLLNSQTKNVQIEANSDQANVDRYLYLVVGGTRGLEVDFNHDVTIPNGDLDLSSNLIDNVNRINGQNGSGINFSGSFANIETGGNNINFYDTTNSQSIMDILEGGNVTIPNGDLDITSGGFFGLPQRTGDSGASVGDLWYRSDLD